MLMLTFGSSPRTRGTGPTLLDELRMHRFIPAHAGNRPANLKRRCRSPVHPRARGEQSGHVLQRCAVIGSSPRTRGTGIYRVKTQFAARFIPAHAGNS